MFLRERLLIILSYLQDYCRSSSSSSTPPPSESCSLQASCSQAPRQLPISRPHAVRRCVGPRWAALKPGGSELVSPWGNQSRSSLL